MALRPLQAQYPLGQFDGLDAEVTSFLGGEVCSLTGVSSTGSDKHAADIGDGYAAENLKLRPAVTLTLSSGMRPLWLSDEGTTNYGTLFGTVVGGSVGQVVSGGAALGPHTATGSGKITCWDKPGLYAVTLDATDQTVNGLVPANTNCTVGCKLYATTAGKLTPYATSAFEATLVVARFIEFTTDGSLVRTSVDMVQALNSPVGAVPAKLGFTQAVIHFSGAFNDN